MGFIAVQLGQERVRSRAIFILRAWRHGISKLQAAHFGRVIGQLIGVGGIIVVAWLFVFGDRTPGAKVIVIGFPTRETRGKDLQFLRA